MLWFIVLLLVLGGGFYCYFQLKEIERQVRDEQAREKEHTEQEQQQPSEHDRSSSGDSNGSASKSVEASVARSATEAEEQQAGDKPAVSDAEATILESVQNQPGIVQSDLYPQFPEMSKKQLQELIKRMADDKKLKRQPYRSSYQLYPA